MKKVNIYWYKYQFSEDERKKLESSSVGERVQELIAKSKSVERDMHLRCWLIAVGIIALYFLIFGSGASFMVIACFAILWALSFHLREADLLEENKKMQLYREEVYLVYNSQKRYGVAMGELLQQVLYGGYSGGSGSGY